MISKEKKKERKKKFKKIFWCFLMLPLPSTCSPLLGYQSFPSSGYPPMRPSKILPRVPLPSPSKKKERLTGRQWKRIHQLQQLQSPHHLLQTKDWLLPSPPIVLLPSKSLLSFAK
jgi:hypothetical protein